MRDDRKHTIGSLFAGIGGFDLGFERAGYTTVWQVEINSVCRAVLAERFAPARQFADVRECGRHNLAPVDVITAGSPARTSPSPDRPAKEKGLRVSEAVCSGKSYVSSQNFGPSGWYLKMSQACSLSMMARTLRQSSTRLPTAGMWDAGGCLMLVISESPRHAAGFSWLRVLESSPPWSCWLTPQQWKQYLLRLHRSKSHGPRIHGQPVLYLPMRHARSPLVVKLSLLMRTDGVRWLSGSERLRIAGFASEWMRPTLQKLGVPEMPLCRKSRSGSPES